MGLEIGARLEARPAVLHSLRFPPGRRQWSIQETSATQGKGLHEGFDWLVSCIKGGAPGTSAPPVTQSASVSAPAAASAGSVAPK
jgi:hypothetical protein